MTKIDQLFASYSDYHRTPGNKITHYLGIPMILFSTLGLLSVFKITSLLDVGFLLWVAATLYYLSLDWKRAAPFSILTLALYWLSLRVSIPIHWVLFVAGWILQGIGHYVYEKKSPAFFTNLTHILIGPFWIFCHFWGKLKARA
jgi:uncharacterized membrane protein YGL010W